MCKFCLFFGCFNICSQMLWFNVAIYVTKMNEIRVKSFDSSFLSVFLNVWIRLRSKMHKNIYNYHNMCLYLHLWIIMFFVNHALCVHVNCDIIILYILSLSCVIARSFYYNSKSIQVFLLASILNFELWPPHLSILQWWLLI